MSPIVPTGPAKTVSIQHPVVQLLESDLYADAASHGGGGGGGGGCGGGGGWWGCSQP